MAGASCCSSAALCYLIASVYYGAGTVRPDASQRKPDAGAGPRGGGMMGAVAHTAAIGARCIETHLPPLVNAPDTLSATGWAIALAFLLLQLTAARDRTAALGAVGMPLAFLAVFAGSALRLGKSCQSSGRLADLRLHGLDGNLVNLHVLAIIFAFGLLDSGCRLRGVVPSRGRLCSSGNPSRSCSSGGCRR